MASKDWTTAQIRINLADRIKDVIDKQLDPSITNSSQFIDLAIRKLIEKMEAQNNS